MWPHLFHCRRRCGLLTFITVLFVSAHLPAADDSSGLAVNDIGRDGTGRVWGMAKSTAAGLYSLDDKEQWQPSRPKGIDEKANSALLGRRADGSVVCIWSLREHRYQWSSHRGGETRIGAVFAINERGFGHDLRLTADSKGNLWLTQQGPDIYRLAPDGTVEHAHNISADECLAGTYEGVNPTTSVWCTVSAFEDAGGRMWFWTDHADGGSNGATIRGALVYEDGKFVQHDFLLPDGSPQRSLTALAQKDSQHLYFARLFDGLYTLDTTTFQAERVPDQPKEAKVTSFAVHDRCGSWYFVMGQNRAEGGCELWRLAGNNRWEKVIDPVDARYDFEHQQDRVWSSSDRGEFLGTNKNGMWFLPNSAAPIHVDWQQHFPLATPHRLIDLQNGRWLGVNTNGLTWVGSPDTLTAERTVPGNPRIRIVRTEYPLHVDPRGHLWGTFSFNSPVLREWDGEHWIEHPFPAEVSKAGFLHILALDPRGRIWLRSFSQKKQTAIYYPALGQWQSFESFDQALEAQVGQPAVEFAPSHDRFDLPRFGPEDQICYLSQEWKVAVFSDHTWRRWSRAEVTGQQNHFIFDGPPFFTRAGRAGINADHQTWEYSKATGWKSIAFEEGFADGPPSSPTAWKPDEEAKLPFKPDSAVEDQQGGWWLIRQRGLYKYREGLCVPMLKADETQPFNDGRRLGQALIDPRGNAFLRDEDNRVEYVILTPPCPPPRTTVSEEVAADAGESAAARDRVVVMLTTDAAPVEGKVRFRWRLDDGRWNALAADGPTAAVTLDSVPGGSHRFEARSLDSTLQTDIAPAVFSFEIHVDPRAQISGFITELAEPDDAKRKAAVLALARQPELALPALRTARATTTDENQRWWIDAALQQIETSRRK